MIRVNRCLGVCRLDVGVRILLFFDLINNVLAVWQLIRKLYNENYDDDYGWLFIVIGIKLLIILSAQVGLDNNKPNYLLPYLVCNVAALLLIIRLEYRAIFGHDSRESYFIELAVAGISFKFLFINFNEFFGCIFNMMLLIYYFIVVNSYYQILLEFDGVNGNRAGFSNPPERETASLAENLRSSAANN